MTIQLSFTKNEHKIIPNFRQKINQAESTEDVKKFFVQTSKKLFEDIFGQQMQFGHEDFELRVDSKPYYSLSDRILSSEDIRSVWEKSDLSRVIFRLAESAKHRYRNLEKNPDKSDSKIRA